MLTMDSYFWAYSLFLLVLKSPAGCLIILSRPLSCPFLVWICHHFILLVAFLTVQAIQCPSLNCCIFGTMQDIAIVPFLVLLPVVEGPEMDGQMSTMALLTSLGPTALKTLGGLGLLLLGGRFVLRRIFEIVAQARSDETFVALCLLTVTGASLCTQRLGFSDTLGAFCAGVLLAETNYRTQVVSSSRLSSP